MADIFTFSEVESLPQEQLQFPEGEPEVKKPSTKRRRKAVVSTSEDIDESKKKQKKTKLDVLKSRNEDNAQRISVCLDSVRQMYGQIMVFGTQLSAIEKQLVVMKSNCFE